MKTGATNELVTIPIPPVPAMLAGAVWIPISEDYCNHPLERAQIETNDGLAWLRKANSKEQLYVASRQTNLWNCAKCGGALLGVRVAHPIWDGPFPCSGSGQCKYEQAPYCPTCEKEPSQSGNPIETRGKMFS